MAFELLARKYRPKNFTEVIGQGPIVHALMAAVFAAEGQSQVILLSGTRGVGKTSLARILAKARNCPNKTKERGPCLTCSSCVSIDDGSSLDFLELDGASHNGVENVREIIDSLSYRPNIGPYKIYVIDEVHMLSQAAFNALLKTIEEPPAHVQFIFATTEVDKIPDTIMSRCLRFDLKSLSTETLFQHLKTVANKENLQVEDSLLSIIAREARGSVRDALTLFDQVRLLSTDTSSTGSVSGDISAWIGIAKESVLEQVFQAIWTGNASALMTLLDEVFAANLDEKRFTQQFADKLYARAIQATTPAEQMELSWMFETFCKDVDWALRSVIPDKSIRIILHKLSKRQEWFSSEGKQEVKIEMKKEVAPTAVTSNISSLISSSHRHWALKDFCNLMDKLFLRAPGLYSHLQQTIFLEGEDKENGGLNLKLGLRSDAKIFFEYFGDEQRRMLRTHVADALEKDVSLVSVELIFPVTDQETRPTFFEFQGNAQKQKQADQKEDLLNSPQILKLKQAFNATIEQVHMPDN
jgi:DNA polymerase III subunit gamma/tau